LKAEFTNCFSMRLITLDDIIDTYSRISQRGSQFVLSKFTFSDTQRTKSAFNETAIHSSNWWMIPKVKERWNIKISGDKELNYKQFLIEQFFQDKKYIRLLSLGSGSCGHELELAAYPQFKEIVCVDLAQNRLDEAAEMAQERDLTNIQFVCANIEDYAFPSEHFDMVLFNSSLHHFKNVDGLLKDYIKPCMREEAHLIINEYVGPTRLQFPKHQLKAINESLTMIPSDYRKRFKTNKTKKRFYGSGIIRMIMADPSECIDSASIIPAIHKHFKITVEKPYGGNILMNSLKDISHHFLEVDEEKSKVLEALFEFEDQYLLENKSDFVFGIYQK